MKCRVCKEDVEIKTLLPDVCAACTLKASNLMQGPRIGDKVATVAKALGFKQKEGCGCRERQTALNNVNLNGPASEVAKALLQAMLNPKGEKI